MTPILSNQTTNLDPTPGQISQMVNPERLDTVTGLSFSPDGRSVVSSTRTEGRAVRVWNLADGAIEFAFLAFSPDSKLLVSTDVKEPGIRLWEERTGHELGRLSGPRDHTAAVAFSPDGRTLASTGGDGSLKLWHLATRREVATLMESGATGPVAFSPDGTLLIVGLTDHALAFRAASLAEIDRER